MAYRHALNHVSAIAFANGKMSHGMRRQTLVYQELRERFGLPSQMACHAPRQVAAAYKTLWERAKAHAAHTARGWTKRRYKGLDKAPQFTALTVTLNHRRDWALGKEHTVSVGTLEGRIRCRYEGWNQHLGWLEQTRDHGITQAATPSPIVHRPEPQERRRDASYADLHMHARQPLRPNRPYGLQ